MDTRHNLIYGDYMQLRKLAAMVRWCRLWVGCMGMSQGYGRADDEQSVRTLHSALDAGITLLDTAMSYGAGANERLISRVLADRRDEATLATKWGIVRGEGGVRVDARPERAAEDLNASLERLCIDAVDLYYLHRVDPDVPIEDSIGAMADLVAEGSVQHIGVSEVTAEQLERACAVHRIAAVQTEWSLTWREAEDSVVPMARRLGVSIVPYSPLGRGMLAARVDPAALSADDMRRRDPRFAEATLRQNAQLVEAIAGMASDRGATPAQLALAWLLAQGDDVVPIPGTKRVDRLAENIAAAEIKLTAAELERIETLAPRGSWAGNRLSFGAPVTTRGEQ